MPLTHLGRTFQLLETYRVIIDSSDALANAAVSGQSRPTSVETIERMMQSAAYGAQMLETAITQAAPSVAPSETRSPDDQGADEASGETNGKSSKAQVVI
jgi:hypothetical protein